ncbi:hypothetical protein J2W42_002226 [Rhizobium tibeticum]|nr:hypothetical protein [Rhizobium tibeticum]
MITINSLPAHVVRHRDCYQVKEMWR